MNASNVPEPEHIGKILSRKVDEFEDAHGYPPDGDDLLAIALASLAEAKASVAGGEQAELL